MAVPLLDTCILIDILRGKPSAVDLYSNLEAEAAVSVVSVQELLAGARPAELKDIQALLATFTHVPVDFDVAYKSGEYLNQYFRSHGVGSNDSFIAATATLFNYQLLTLNLKHFPMIPDLKKAYL